MKLLAKGEVEKNRAEQTSVTPLMVQMHAYDALASLGGKGTTILLGDFSHVPSFLFPRLGAFANAYPGPVTAPAAAKNPTPSAVPAGTKLPVTDWHPTDDM